MQAWVGMLKKELRLTNTFVMMDLIVVIVFGCFDVWLAHRAYYGVATILFLVLSAKHLLYLPVYLLGSLGKEWRMKAPLWLQAPQSGWWLLSVKLFSGVVAMLVSGGVMYGFLMWITRSESGVTPAKLGTPPFDPHALVQQVQHGALLGFGILLYLSFFAGVWTMLISIVLQSLKHILRRGRWLVGIVLFVGATALWAALTDTSAFKAVFSFGTLHTGYPLFDADAPLHIGDFVLDLLLFCGLFGLAGWLLDKRVEA